MFKDGWDPRQKGRSSLGLSWTSPEWLDYSVASGIADKHFKRSKGHLSLDFCCALLEYDMLFWL
jgi:hypothetical protein